MLKVNFANNSIYANVLSHSRLHSADYIYMNVVLNMTQYMAYVLKYITYMCLDYSIVMLLMLYPCRNARNLET